MTVLLVRHAVAVARKRWSGDDDDVRPLNGRGRRQSQALVERLVPFAITRFLSSPAVRCVDTVAPAAAAGGVKVDQESDLAEGRGSAALTLVRSLLDGTDDVVLCTHGDVIGDVLNGLDRTGARLGSVDRCQKGSTWVLERHADGCIQGWYVPPPE